LDSVTATTGVQVTVTNDCGTSNGAATIDVHTLSVGGPIEVCLADQASLVANNTTSGGNWTYVGPVGATATFSPNEQDDTPGVDVDVEGTYQFTYTNDECSMARTWEVVFAPAPTVEILMDTNRICVEDDIVLTYSTNTDFFEALSWSPFGGSMDTLVIAGTDSTALNLMDTSYHVMLSVSNFCGTDESEVIYDVIDCTLEIPSIFNPESDVEENSYFHIDALELHPGNEVLIFDRWGRKVYKTENYHLNPWDGGKSSDGVYYYVLVRPGYEAETGYVHLVRGGS